ncbi:MAG: PQQ-like beta-propeller repeat protein [Alphaproteobacteria bacterium]
MTLSCRSGLAVLALPLLLTACGGNSWFGVSEDETPLPGERIPVMALDSRLTPDLDLADKPATVPEPEINSFWPQAGGYPNHAMKHLSLDADLRVDWRADIGTGRSGTYRLTSEPIVVDERIFAMDSESRVSAFNTETGRRLWQVETAPDGDEGDGLAGGIAFGGSYIYATSGYGQVVALDPETGDQKWARKLSSPSRAAPTIHEGRVFVTTLDNKLLALSAEDGTPIWDHSGILEETGLLGAGSPAAMGPQVVVGYSSGEIVSLRIENGRVLWADSLASLRRRGLMSRLAHIRGAPVMDGRLVYAVSNSGRTVAIDQRNGVRVWQAELGGSQRPWPAGDSVFVITSESELVALERISGRIRWVTQLDRYEDGDEDNPRTTWVGPVLAGGSLIAVSSDGRMAMASPATGDVVDMRDVGDSFSIPPVVAGKTLYLLDDSGTLYAIR